MILAEALHGCARSDSRAQLFAGLDALAEGPLGGLGITLVLSGADQLPRVVHSGGAGADIAGAALSPVFAQIADATISTGSPMSLRALHTLPLAQDDAHLRALTEAGVRAIACVPFGTPRAAPGVLFVRYDRDDALAGQEMDLLSDVALLAALCLERIDGSVSAAPPLPTEPERRQRHLALMGELVPALIHDLNNPLTGILAFAELLEAEIVEPDQRESLGYIRREAQQAARLLRDLQMLARPSSPDTLADVNQLVEAAVRLRGYPLRAAGAKLRVTLAPELPPVQGDTQALLQVLMHLLSRAETVVRQAEPSERIVEVSTRREEQVAVLQVTDTGPGMSPEELGRMFDVVSPAGAQASATGVGLSIAKAIVEAHGGSMAVDGGPGRSTRIVVRLPMPFIAESRSPASP